MKHYLGSWYQTPARREVSYPHHLSHAAAGFQTSPYDRAVVVVIDAIGELDTISIYQAWYDDKGHAQYKRIWRQGYPHSIGLFYSAMTQRVGLRPIEEEYITKGMAAWGRPARYQTLANHVVEDIDAMTLKRNLHIGVEQDFASPHATAEDLAHATQELAEYLILSVMRRARDLTGD